MSLKRGFQVGQRTPWLMCSQPPSYWWGHTCSPPTACLRSRKHIGQSPTRHDNYVIIWWVCILKTWVQIWMCYADHHSDMSHPHYTGVTIPHYILYYHSLHNIIHTHPHIPKIRNACKMICNKKKHTKWCVKYNSLSCILFMQQN